MKQSKIFYSDTYKKIENDIASFLNSQKDFMSETTSSSPRAAGDAIQSILADNFGNVVGDVGAEYSAQFARRAMADIAFTDKDSFY